jgi:hypothetical protein
MDPEHPAVIFSPEELCTDPHKTGLNVLYGTTKRPGGTLSAHEVLLMEPTDWSMRLASVVLTSTVSIAER